MPNSISKSFKAPSKGKALATVKTDIFISIKPQHMNNIVSRTKNHEFRQYLISEKVERMCPDQTLRYVATISKGKSPGDIATPGDSSEDGIGNAEFNDASKQNVTRYAYEILHLYKLRAPLLLVDLRENYTLSPPQRFSYLPRQLFEDVVWAEQEQLF